MQKITNSIILIFAFVLLMCNALPIYATHVAGGTMTYRCLGNDRYEISMEFRRDCLNGDEAAPFDDPAHFGVYDQNFNLVSISVLDEIDPTITLTGAFNIPLTRNDTLIETLTTECNVISGDVCIQTTLYRDTIRLPFLEGGYTILYQRCCRNITLSNIVEPINTGATYFVTITDDALRECNSSPQWDTWPSIFICADDTLRYNHSARDIDGDSLVYSLCIPTAGLTVDNNIWEAPPIRNSLDDVVLAGGFSLNNLFGGGDPLVIDPNTGAMFAVPPAVENQYLVGVCVSEFRDGKLLSVVKRDFEYNVRTCGRAPVAIAEPDAFQKCNSLEIDFANNTTSNFKPSDSLDYTWIFDFPNENLISNEQEPSFTYPRSGVYNVALVADDGTCNDTTFLQVAVATEDDPDVGFRLEAVSCNPNNLINLTALHNIPEELDSTDFEWIITVDGVDNVLNGPQLEFNIGTAQEVSVTLNIVGPTGCTSTHTETQVISTVQNPMASFNLDAFNCNSITTIELASDIVSTESVADDDIVWTIVANGETFIVTGANPNFDIINDQAISVSLTVTTPNGCTNNVTENFNVETAADPEISFTHSATNCSNTTILSLSGSATSTTQNIDPGSYNWEITTTSGEILEGNGVIFNQDITVDQIVSVQLQVSTLEGCTTTISESIQVVTTPFDPVFRDQIVCPGETAVIYTEQNPGNQVTITPEPAGLTVDANGNYLAPNQQNTTNYTVTVSNADCSRTSAVLITVDSNPTFAPIADVLQCGDNTIQLNPSAITSYIYNWEGPPGANFDTNADNPTISVPSSGSYVVTITTSATSNCFAFDTVQVNRVEFPSLSFSPDRELIFCEDETIELTATSNGAVTWFDNNGNVVQTGNTFTVTGLTESTTYSVQTATPEGCTTEDQVEIQFIPAPEIVIDAASPSSACFGDDLTVSVDTDNQITWTTEAGEVLQVGPTLTISGLDQDTTLIITAENDLGCMSQQSISLSVLDLPGVDPALNERNICRGVGFTLEAELTQFDVVVFDNMDNVISTDHSLDINEGLESSTSYVFQYTTGDGCVAYDTTFVNVFDEVGLNINSGNEDQIFCRGFVPEVSATTNADSNIEWFVDGELVATGNDIEEYIPNGDAMLIAIATTTDGCTQADTIQLQQSFAEGNITGDEVICIGESAILTYNPDIDTDFNITWTPTNDLDVNGRSATVSPIETTTYTATYSNDDGCLDTTQFTVTVGGFAEAPFIDADSLEICRTGSTELFIDTDSNNDINWTPTESLDDPSIINPTATPEESTTYAVTVIDQFGCTTSNSIDISVIQPTCDENDVFIPNMFTPNFDNLNDVFMVESVFLANMELIVYNRWGEEVFITDQVGQGWDGTFQGEELEPDVYGYYFTGTCVNGFTVQMQGNVTLLK